MSSEHWMNGPEDHDFPAALSYLTLLMEPVTAGRLVEALKNSAATDTHEAKDILRASGLPLLAKDNAHVKSDLNKVGEGRKLAPVLLIRGEPSSLTAITGFVPATTWTKTPTFRAVSCRAAEVI